MRRIADSTVRRLSLYLRFLEESTNRGLVTISSDELARRGGTTSAQVRKDLSFFGSFGKRGLGYSVPELTESLREILGLRRDWQVIIVGAGKIGTALAQYRGFRQRGFRVTAVYDRDPKKIGTRWDSLTVRDMAEIERDIRRSVPTSPCSPRRRRRRRSLWTGWFRRYAGAAQLRADSVQVPPEVTLKNVNMAMGLEGLSFALTNRDR